MAVQVSDPAVKVVAAVSGSEIQRPKATSKLFVPFASAILLDTGPVPLGASPSALVAVEAVSSHAPCQVEGVAPAASLVR
ncbi:hypothetical protein HYT32_01950 [Candidatus Roizmanbacteria bacterium]|nr:hypothetical protein [Candidatus Roizmanbacteria bacterium]